MISLLSQKEWGGGGKEVLYQTSCCHHKTKVRNRCSFLCEVSLIEKENFSKGIRDPPGGGRLRRGGEGRGSAFSSRTMT